MRIIINDLFKLVMIIFIFSAILCVCWAGNKLKNKTMKSMLAFLLTACMLAFIYVKSLTGTNFISYFMLSVVMCASTFILGFIQYKPYDYAVMFSLFLLLNRSIYLGSPFISLAVNSLLILAAFLCITKIRLGKIRGQIFHIWLNFIIVFTESVLIKFCFDRIVRKIGYLFQLPLLKIAVWLLATLIMIGISVLLIYLIKYLCHDYFKEINEMGKKYPSIEKHFITISVGILLFFILICFLSNYVYGYNQMLENLITITYFFSIFIQLLFLTQLFRVSYLRESLYNKEIENVSLLAYSSDLERNFSEIQGIKHDIKNLFATMGQYVNRSNDEEMKDFYASKICPFAEGQIMKNDLYAKLMVIDHEQLRAFLYYKLSQALELGITVSVEIQPIQSKYNVQMDFSDIVRILGILIDNAIEESMAFPVNETDFAIQMVQNPEITSIKIQNRVTEEKLRTGIKSGVSTKSKDRGRGLKIVNEIIARYGFVTLNSYFKDGIFIQNLQIYRTDDCTDTHENH